MVTMEKITDEEMDMRDDIWNSEVGDGVASCRYQRDNTSDVNLINFYNTQIEKLKERRV